jgi:rubrerythrin
MSTTRAQFLRNGSKGTLALVAGGTVLASMKGDAFAQTSGPSDLDLAKFAAGAELLATVVYDAAIKSKYFKGGTLTYLKSARKAEQAHYNALAAIIKGAGQEAPTKSDFTFAIPRSATRNATSVVKFAIVLETAFLGAYLGAVKELDDPTLKVAAAGIAANEASHLGFFKNAAKPGAVIDAIPQPGDLAEIIKTVNSLAKPKA